MTVYFRTPFAKLGNFMNQFELSIWEILENHSSLGSFFGLAVVHFTYLLQLFAVLFVIIKTLHLIFLFVPEEKIRGVKQIEFESSSSIWLLKYFFFKFNPYNID